MPRGAYLQCIERRRFMHRFRLLAPLALAWLASGCIYANVRAPLSYRSPTPSDVAAPLGGSVDGEACNQMVLWVVAWGDGGYAAAVENAKAKSGAALLADVQADQRLFNVLGVYQKTCTRVRGRVVR
jgi:hypothetical protein